jgi:hypothetical protein
MRKWACVVGASYASTGGAMLVTTAGLSVMGGALKPVNIAA